MKRLPIIIALAGLITSMAMGTAGCSSENTWDDYAEWRTANQTFYNGQLSLTNPDGTPYYTRITPGWYPSSGVLVHWFNDRSLTAGNLQPLVTSTIDDKYIGLLYNAEPIHSSYLQTANGDSIFRTQLTSTIDGWQIAVTQMRVGDSCRVVVPFQQGYQAQATGSIPPYSTLVFDIKLTDIVSYEAAP